MTVTIHYEAEDGVETINRDEWHSDKGDFITAFWNPDDETGVFKKVYIPTHRVIRIEE